LNFDFLQNQDDEVLRDEMKKIKMQIVEKKHEIELIKNEQNFEIEDLKQRQGYLEQKYKKSMMKLELVISQTTAAEERLEQIATQNAIHNAKA